MLYSEDKKKLRILAILSTKIANDKYESKDHIKMSWTYSGRSSASILRNRRIYLKEEAARIAKQIVDKVTASECLNREFLNYEIEISDMLHNAGIEASSDIVEGLLLGFYTPPVYDHDGKQRQLESKQISIRLLLSHEFGHLKHQLDELIDHAVSITEAVIWARDMVNKPGNLLRPHDFSEEIRKLLHNTKVSIEVLETEKIEELGMSGLSSVGMSSAYPPKLIVLRYKNNTSEEKIALVGKGVTCDTGGYCLKNAASMTGIKGDMAGAAAVVGAIKALAETNAPVNTIGLIPICENRISNSSLVPGDVIGSHGGKSVEIINTDAEGRLILADAVSYAAKECAASAIIDVATLTGAVVNMLGFSIGGALCDSDELNARFVSAYSRSGEQYWLLPAYAEHMEMLKSDIADIKNLGPGHCGTITAGLFIRSFADDKPWLHLDIAGTAWVDKPIFEFQNQGATGAAVSTLYYLCRGDK